MPRTSSTTTVAIETPGGIAAVDAEVVNTRPQRARGLMYRKRLAPDAGMLFVMDTEADHGFYMRNTLIPLDIIYIGRDMTIAGIAPHAEPLTEVRRHVGRQSIYVLETNAGWAARHYVMPGARVWFV